LRENKKRKNIKEREIVERTQGKIDSCAKFNRSNDKSGLKKFLFIFIDEFYITLHREGEK